MKKYELRGQAGRMLRGGKKKVWFERWVERCWEREELVLGGRMC